MPWKCGVLLLAWVAASGCGTLELQRREEAQHRTRIDQLALDTQRLSDRVAALNVAQERVYRDVETVHQELRREIHELRQQLDVLSREVAGAGAARERLKNEIIEHLSARLNEIMRSQAASSPRPRSVTGYEHVVRPGETLSEIAKAYGVTLNAIVRENNITEQTFYRWRRKYGGMDVSEARKLRDLERENAELKRMVADLSLDNRMLKELNSKKW